MPPSMQYQHEGRHFNFSHSQSLPSLLLLLILLLLQIFSLPPLCCCPAYSWLFLAAFPLHSHWCLPSLSPLFLMLLPLLLIGLFVLSLVFLLTPFWLLFVASNLPLYQYHHRCYNQPLKSWSLLFLFFSHWFCSSW